MLGIANRCTRRIQSPLWELSTQKDTAKTRFVRLGTIISVSRKLKPVASSQKDTTS